MTAEHEDDAAPADPADPAGERPAGVRARLRARARLTLVLVAVIAYAIDLTTKELALAHLADREPVSVVGDLLQLRLVFNPGAAFSLGTDFTVVLSVVSIIAALVVLVLARRVGSHLWGVGLGLLLGGVLGNLTDRLFRDPSPFHGHVVDMFALPNFPVFNVADMCINVAAAVIVVQSFRGIALSGRRVDAGEHAAADAGEER